MYSPCVLLIFVTLSLENVSSQFLINYCPTKNGFQRNCVKESECLNSIKGYDIKIDPSNDFCSFFEGEIYYCCPKVEKISAKKCSDYHSSLITLHGVENHIFDGSITEAGEFPHMVAIGWPVGNN